MNKIMKTVIFMGYECNNMCDFCLNEDKRRNIRSKSTKEILADIEKSRAEGSNYLELIGGEPTIRKDFFEILLHAKKLGYETIMMATNGRMLSNEKFAKKILDCGINHIVFSIHGHNAEIHDLLTKVPGSFDQLIKGIKNIQRLGLTNIGSNTTLVKQNYKYAVEIGELIFNLGIRNAEFIFVDPNQGAPLKRFESIVPTYEETSPYVNKLLEFGSKRDVKHWAIRYYPLCFVDKEYHNMISEIQERNTFLTKHKAVDFTNDDASEGRRTVGRMQIKRCETCEYKDICEGFWRTYVEKNKLE